MQPKCEIDVKLLVKMWTDGVAKDTICRTLHVGTTTLDRRVKDLGLPRRTQGSVPSKADRAAAVIPAKGLPDRRDYPDIVAAVLRAKANPRPVAALGNVAARFRAPWTEVNAMAERLGVV